MALVTPIISIGKDTVSLKLRLLTPRVLAAAESTIAKETIKLAAKVKRNYSDTGLQVRTGALRRSIVPGPILSGPAGVTGSVLAGQKLPYARIQEFGGTIRPVHAQFLAIPLGPWSKDKTMPLTAKGVSRFGPLDAEQAGWRTFIAKNIIFGRQPGDRTPTPLFALKKEVTIPARPYFWPTVEASRAGMLNSLAQSIMAAVNAQP